MRHIEIALPAGASDGQVVRAVDRAIARAGLNVTLRGTLKKYTGCVHWHVRNGRESGTLELTFWPAEQRAWFTVQNGRTADWIEEGMHRIRRAIRSLAES